MKGERPMANVSMSSHVVHWNEFTCPECGSEQLRRLARQGLLQRKVYPLFGLFPWECPICRQTRLFRVRGKRIHSTDRSS